MRLFHFLLLILLGGGFSSQSFAQISIPPVVLKRPSDTSVSYGDVYGAVRYDIEKLSVPSQEYWLRGLIQTVFGIKDSGEYLIALEVNDDAETGAEKLIARKVIAHFVKNESGNLINGFLDLLKGTEIGEKKVRDASLISFSGNLLTRVPIKAKTNNYSIALQVYKSKSAELTSSDLLQSVLEVINSSSGTLKFTPLGDGVKDVYGKMRQLGFDLYKGLTDNSVLVVSQSKMSFIKANQSNADPNIIRYDFPFEFDKPAGGQICRDGAQTCFKNVVQIRITFDTYPSEVGNFKAGKFSSPRNWSQWLVQGTIADKNVVQWLAERETTKQFVAAVSAGKSALAKFAQANDVASSCDAVVNELKLYYSAADVAALYWAFLQQYSSAIGPQLGESCQSKYADIFFGSYGLPLISAPPAQTAESKPKLLEPGSMPTKAVAETAEPIPKAKPLSNAQLGLLPAIREKF